MSDEQASEDQDVLDALASVLRFEAQTPPELLATLTSLHDWSRLDASVAELVAESGLVGVRDGAALESVLWRKGPLALEVTVTTVGTDRRELAGYVDGGEVRSVTIQTAGGVEQRVEVDDLGDFTVVVTTGAIRFIIETDTGQIATTWHRV